MGLFTQKDLAEALEKAERRIKREKKQKREIAIKFMNTNRQIFNKVVITSLFGGCY